MAHVTEGIETPRPGAARTAAPSAAPARTAAPSAAPARTAAPSAAPARTAAPSAAPQTTRAPRWAVELSDEVVAWYARLGPRDRAYADRAFDRLEQHGPALGMPHGRVIGDGLHELRFACEGVSRRVTYTLGEGREVLALTTFRKQRTHERQEIERASRAQVRAAEREKGRSRAW
jgi:hypothetical protein